MAGAQEDADPDTNSARATDGAERHRPTPRQTFRAVETRRHTTLKDRSGSVWPVSLAHGTVNVRIDRTPYILVLSPVAFFRTGTESGFVTMAAALVVAAVLLLRGHTWER
jgi:hypothetical protein